MSTFEERAAARKAEFIASLPPAELAAYQAKQQLRAIIGTASAAFETLPKGKQALWETVRAAVEKAITAGDIPAAIEILTTMPVIYPGAEADRQIFLDLFAEP